MIRRLDPTPRARRQRRRVALWALWAVTWPVLGVVLSWDATPASGPDWAALVLMVATWWGVWWVTR